ncbi:MAG TPA: sialidase family protein, partial [Streptosporangiaceae bacterium]
YVTTFQSGVYRSADSGSTWHQLALPGDVIAFCLVIDPSNASRVWVGTAYDGIVRTTDGGSTWASGQGGPGAETHSLAIDPHNHKRLFGAIEADTGGGVYVTSDGGYTWSRSTGGAAPESSDVVAADPTTQGRVYTGNYDLYYPGKLGVYRSDDDGVSWGQVSVAGLYTRTPRSLVVQPDGVIHLGSIGGGIFNFTPTS